MRGGCRLHKPHGRPSPREQKEHGEGGSGEHGQAQRHHSGTIVGLRRWANGVSRLARESTSVVARYVYDCAVHAMTAPRRTPVQSQTVHTDDANDHSAQQHRQPPGT